MSETKTYPATCKTCGCVTVFVPKDLREDGHRSYAYCPVCEERVDLGVLIW